MRFQIRFKGLDSHGRVFRLLLFPERLLDFDRPSGGWKPNESPIVPVLSLMLGVKWREDDNEVSEVVRRGKGEKVTLIT